MTTPILYSFRRCPYAMRARIALRVAGVTCRLREVVLRDKPEHMLEISPKGTVPVIQRLDGTVLEESLEIMRWALEGNDPESWLQPELGSLADTNALIQMNDGDFKHHLDRYKYANRYENADPAVHRAEAEGFLRVLESRLEGSAALYGDRWSLADAAIAPFIRQFANADRAWFGAAPYPRLQDWLASFLADERFTAIMRKYPQWHPGEAETIFPEDS
jgi:glutathione S-transferase